jgi:TusA-related sulfurtransferase
VIDDAPPTRRLALLGVPCPINWAHAKAALAQMKPRETLELLVDDPRAEQDIPRAAEMEGYCVVAVRHGNDQLRILIEV